MITEKLLTNCTLPVIPCLESKHVKSWTPRDLDLEIGKISFRLVSQQCGKVYCAKIASDSVLKGFFFNLYWSPWELLQNWWETAAKETSIKLFLASAVFGFLWVNALFDSDALDNLGIYHLVFFSFLICLKLKSSHFSGRALFTFNWMYLDKLENNEKL